MNKQKWRSINGDQTIPPSKETELRGDGKRIPSHPHIKSKPRNVMVPSHIPSPLTSLIILCSTQNWRGLSSNKKSVSLNFFPISATPILQPNRVTNPTRFDVEKTGGEFTPSPFLLIQTDPYTETWKGSEEYRENQERVQLHVLVKVESVLPHL